MTQEQITLEKLYFFMKQKFEQMDQRFIQIDQRFDKLETRLDNLENRMEQRFQILESQISTIQVQVETMNNQSARLEAKFNDFQKDDKRNKFTFSKWMFIGNSFLSAIVSFLTTIFINNKL